MKRRFKATLAYNGSNYHGWAKQPNQQTIQGILESTIYSIFKQRVVVYAAGRTDAGVNASGQVIHFDFVNIQIKPKQIMVALNKALPYDIRVVKIQTATKDFNARFNAKSKTYTYYINTNTINDAVKSTHIYQHNKTLNLTKIKKVSKLFLGEHNFLSFSTDERKGESLIRLIKKIDIQKQKDLVKISVTGTGFLRSQIRMMVGCLLAYNEKKISIDEIKQWLKTPKKGQATYKAPACGLCLEKVRY